MKHNVKKIAIFSSLTVATVMILLVVMYQMIMMATYDEELHQRAEIAEENAKKRVEAMKEMQEEAMCEDERFDHSSCS